MRKGDLPVFISIVILCSIAGIWLWKHKDDCILCKGVLSWYDHERLMERSEL